MEQLKDVFDFCIQAENVGVAKPNKRIYIAALEHVLLHFPHVLPVQFKETTMAMAESILGPWWVHIGDDFFKDVVASKALNMRSVWYRELIKASSNRDDSTPAVTEFLLDSIQQDFADYTVDSFDELYSILGKWHTYDA